MIRNLPTDLSRRNTFGMKVRCARLLEFTEAADLDALDWGALPAPVKVIGGGSNLLFTGDFPGTLLHAAVRGIRFTEAPDGTLLLEAGAGEPFDGLCAEAARRGLWGLENLSLIPGEAGGAAVQNIGAYGVEVKDVLVRVEAYDRHAAGHVTLAAADCGYGYRDSRFKREPDRFVVTGAVFRLRCGLSPQLGYRGIREALQRGGWAGDPAGLTPQAVREAVIGIRREKLPDPAETGSAGSFFKNPVLARADFDALQERERDALGEIPHYDLGESVKVPAAWLIDRCGLKGRRRGGAQVFPTQPLVLVNATGDAAPEDVLALEEAIIERVRERFGICLHPEVEHIGNE